MCGISGFLLARAIDSPEIVLRQMNDTLFHRGPDAGAILFDEHAAIGLAHRRLAIVELSPLGAQPMVSPSGRYTIVFNGEIYNFKLLRDELDEDGSRSRGHSDTEVMLRAFDRWGIRGAVTRFLGMFAFAVWDRAERRLTLVRDRLGKKPLYYGECAGHFVFGSELKALRAFPGFEPPIDRAALAQFVRHNYVPSPRSIYQGIRKVPPGSFVHVMRQNGLPVASSPEVYWSAVDEFSSAKAHPFRGSLSDAIGHLDTLLRDAVALRMIADVPLGVFLSGGVDSSLVVALMQAQSAAPVRTFTIGFNEAGYNEAGHAREIAKYLGTDHTELYIEPQDALDLVPRIPEFYDEPFADSSQLPTYLVSALARRDVTVALSGDGGDEGFCGYNRYIWWRKVWRIFGKVPAPLRRRIGLALAGIPAGVLDQVGNLLQPMLGSRVDLRHLSRRVQQVAELASRGSPAEIYLKLVSHWDRPEEVLLDGDEQDRNPLFAVEPPGLDAYTEHMALLDTVTYLPDDILVKVDRASMAVSLETRAPLLDHRVLEFAWSLPIDYKLSGTRGKVILQELLFRHVPRALVERPKMGFGVPIDSWLRGPLRDWAEDLLAPERLRQEGYFRVETVRSAWQQHLQGARSTHYRLWDVLMFQSWLEHERSRARSGMTWRADSL